MLGNSTGQRMQEFQEQEDKEEMALNQGQQCWSLGREMRGHRACCSVLCHQMGVRVGIITHFDPNQAAFGSALRSACLQQARWVVEQLFGSVMSKSGRCCWTFVSETQAVEF